MAVRYDIVADRQLPYEDDIVFMDEDLTGAAFAMQVRSAPDAPGTPFVDLATVTDSSEGIRLAYAGSATVAAHIAAGRLDSDILAETNPATGTSYASADIVMLSQVRITILSGTLRPPSTGLIPLPRVTGDPSVCAYDLLITRSGLHPVKEFYGAFTVTGTVTQ